MFGVFRTGLFFYDLLLSKLFTRNLPTAAELQEVEMQRMQPQVKLAITHEGKHMQTFAGQDGYVTGASIYYSCIHDWHLPPEDAALLSQSTMQFAYKYNVPGVYWTPFGIKGKFLPDSAVGLLNHPFDTGFFDKVTGMVHPEQFKRLLPFTIKSDDGRQVISEAKFREFLAAWHKQDHRWEGADWLAKMIGKESNDGEFRFYFNRTVIYRDAQGVGYVAIADLKQFLLDSEPTVKAIAAEYLPAAPQKCTTANVCAEIATNSSVPVRVTGLSGILKTCTDYLTPTLATTQAASSFFAPACNGTMSDPAVCISSNATITLPQCGH